MSKYLYQKSNNLFQSAEWLNFQKDFGRTAVDFEDFKGLLLDIHLGKKAIWIQKGPEEPEIKKIREIGKAYGAVFVRVEPLAEIQSSGAKNVTKKSLLSGQTSPKATQVLDISKTEEEILADMKQKTRYNIRLAEKKNVTVKMLDDVDLFYELLQKTSGRDKGYAPHEKKYYKKMIENLAKNDLGHVFVAEHESTPLAAIFVSFYGNLAIYLHGGFNDEKRNLMAPYLCQWEAIKYAKSKGCKFYDFWGVAETDDPKDPWAGITRFKEGFGGGKVIFPGDYDIVINKFWYNTLTLLAKLRRIFK